MENFLVISRGIDVMPLLLAIRRRPELWKEDTFLRDYPQGPFASMESIMLRFPKIESFKGKTAARKEQLYKENRLAGFDQHESIDRPPYKLLPEARKIVMNLMSYVDGERLGRVLVNKIRPGGRIFPHADTPVHADYYSRFHVVLQSLPGVVFRCGNEQAYFEAGTVFWFNNKLEHEVINNSAEDRIHMIVDIRTSR